MKSTLVPYGANVNDWSTGYAFNNVSDFETMVKVYVTSEDGKITREKLVKIDPYAIVVLGPDDIRKMVDGRHSMIIVGPDEVFVIALNTLTTKMGECISSKSVFSLPIYDITELSLKN